MKFRPLALTAVLFTAHLVLPSGPAPELPQYFPTCNSPQPSAPQQAVAGSSTNSRSNPVWNGQEFGVTYVDNTANRLKFVRVYADGTPASPPVTLTSRGTDNSPSLVWNGAGYGVAWAEINPAFTQYQVYFARLNPDGTMIGAELKVSFAGGTAETASGSSPALAWSGAGYAVVWQDNRNNTTTGFDIYGTLLDATGAIAGGGLSHDLIVSNATNAQYGPTVAWSAGYNAYVTVWYDNRSATKYELWGARLSTGGVLTPIGSIVSDASNSFDPSLADTGNGLGLVWYDGRDANYEIYFARLSANGTKAGADLRLTNDVAFSARPRIVWTGGEFGVVWGDTRSATETWFQRVSQGGVAVGVNTQVTYSGNTNIPDLAFGRYGYLLTGAFAPGSVLLQAWGCAADTTPPSCPQNLAAYNITGTTATVGWVPSVEDATDIAYYEVYRNSVFVGKTSAPVFNDSGLSLSGSYNYYVRPVNAAQLVNGSCTNSIYVKTNASLTLMMNKATASDAGLNWTDAGFNSYNLWRGTRPQVMTQIGATPALSSTDPNALSNGSSYFYSVDNPGP